MKKLDWNFVSSDEMEKNIKLVAMDCLNEMFSKGQFVEIDGMLRFMNTLIEEIHGGEEGKSSDADT